MKPYLIALVILLAAVAGLAVQHSVLTGSRAALAASQKATEDAKAAHDRDVKQANEAATAWKARYDDLKKDRDYQLSLAQDAQQRAGDEAKRAATAASEFDKRVKANAGANPCYLQPAGVDVDALLSN